MIQRFILLLSFTIIGATAYSQISPGLQKRLLESEEQFIPLRVEFVTSVDFDVLKASFIQNQTPVKDWPRMVNRVLMKQAQASQASAIALLSTFGENQIKSISSFYIANIMVIEATAEVVEDLSGLPEVSYIDWAGDEFLIHDPIIESDKSKTEAINGTEPGLVAINAPAMWKLGYTGRGRMVYNYDTGVWPTHPSFKDRFLGNFAPLSQSWYGLIREYPDGRISDHGTHTLGTIAGLDTATNDTVGVAFGSYWIANDYVASTVAALPPLAKMMAAFEWALNPDGDTTTSDDVPDVINNSWRWRDDPDTVHCGGFVVQLMNAIEAAGMANVFSGGNSGPNNSSVNSPQRINTSKVNTFSVGSIDGNQSFPYPISSFSTRGPSQCPGSGNLQIHPEVVAPGQNVRSAWGTNGYNTISGTSMAAPHVSGAVLLLKEAFPQLSGAQLMQALYTSAIDMGVAGEDNTYGNGLIDVYAAYQLLALSHSPVNPNDVSWDISIKEITYPKGGEVTCEDLYEPKLIVQNLGDSAIASVDISYWLNGVLGTSTPINVSTPNLLVKGDIDTVSLPNPVTLSVGGDYEFTVFVSIGNQEYDEVNNQRVIRFNKKGSTTLPFYEDFEGGISGLNWYIENDDALTSWDSVSVKGWLGNTRAAYLNLKDYLPRSSQKDGLWSPILQLPTAPLLNLSFDVAYQQLGTLGLVQDTFKIYASTDCGETFPHLLYSKTGSDLSTTGVLGVNFEPVSRSDWRRDNVDLSTFSGQEIMLSFVGINRKGNNLYLDNISVYEGLWDPVSLAETQVNVFSLFPNPATNAIQISSSSINEELLDIQIMDANGRMVLARNAFKVNEDLDISRFAEGLYFVKIIQGKRVEFIKLIKE